MIRRYKHMSAVDTLQRLRLEDYCDEQRTADIIAMLINAANAGAALADLVLRHQDIADQETREALQKWAETVRIMRERGVM
jgi:hypothetical protein